MRTIIIPIIIIAPIAAAAGVFLLADNFLAPPPAIEITPVELAAPRVQDYDQWLSREQQAIIQEKKQALSSITLFMAGDVMLSRAVERKMLAKNDFSYCFKEMKKTVERADLAFANLESPIVQGATVPDNSMQFRAHPKSVESLKYAGFDIVSLANNHFGDQGREGMAQTFNYLTAQNIDYVGAGATAAQMRNPVIKQVKDVKIAFLAYGYGPAGYAAGADRAGLALIDNEQLIKDLATAKEQADVIVVTFHAGVEYQDRASPAQENFARLAIDHGADLAVAHHPHVVQNMELYKGKYIFYSLGNFVFDQMWSRETRQGLGITFTLTKDQGVVDLEYHPVLIEDYCQPRPAAGDDREAIIGRL